MVARLRELLKPRPHPMTGDMLSFGERVSWRVMGAYRRWSVFFLLQALTVIWWVFPHFFPGGLPGWNYLWSDLAVAVEMTVGMAFLNQSLRDASILRAELRELKKDEELIAAIAQDIQLIKNQLDGGNDGST